MVAALKISLDLLKEGKQQEINATISSGFLDIHEEELKFQETVSVQGKAWQVDDHILLEISVQCTAMLPCSICNEWTEHPLFLPHIFLDEEWKETKDRFFDFTEMVRETILLEVPQFTECLGSCPERKNMECYCKKTAEKKIPEYFPFEQLK